MDLDLRGTVSVGSQRDFVDTTNKKRLKISVLFLIYFILQALQRVNACLLEKNSAESLLFDVLLITTDSQHQQQSSCIINSTRHHSNFILITISNTEHYVDLTLTFSIRITVGPGINVGVCILAHGGIDFLP